MTTTFRKLNNASKFYGRGTDQGHQPARYGMFSGETLVAYIYAAPHGSYSSAQWNVANAEGREVKTVYVGGLKAAKAWAAENMGS
jgi:hypothetical protein